MIGWQWLNFKFFIAHEKIMVDRLTTQWNYENISTRLKHGWWVDNDLGSNCLMHAKISWLICWQWVIFKMFNTRKKIRLIGWQWLSFKIFNVCEKITVDRLTTRWIYENVSTRTKHGLWIDNDIASNCLMHAKISWLIGWQRVSFKMFNTRTKITVDRLTVIKLQNL